MSMYTCYNSVPVDVQAYVPRHLRLPVNVNVRVYTSWPQCLSQGIAVERLARAQRVLGRRSSRGAPTRTPKALNCSHVVSELRRRALHWALSALGKQQEFQALDGLKLTWCMHMSFQGRASSGCSSNVPMTPPAQPEAKSMASGTILPLGVRFRVSGFRVRV